MNALPVLIADSREKRRRSIGTALANAGLIVHQAIGLDHLMLDARRHRPGVVVIGISVAEELAALQAIAELHAMDRRLPVVVVIEDGSEALAVAALRAGVKDYFRDPLDVAELASCARRWLAAPAERRPDTAQPPPGSGRGPGTVVAISGQMRRISDYLARVAEHDATVLITGETGTGKELAASLIHGLSSRRRERFVSINCAAIPDALLESELFGYESGAFTGAVGRREGLLQTANGGTVFLDEVADMGPQGQAKILRAIEAREVYRVGGKRPERLDVRFVAATNQDLDQAVEEGRFRKDLYYRLAVVQVHLPALRERRSDISVLLDHYLTLLRPAASGAPTALAEETRHTLEAYDWPGNVRELKNLVQAILVAPPGGPITLADLPDAFRARLRKAAIDGSAERRRLLDALVAAKWNKSRAATMLRWSRMTIYRKMAKYSVIPSTSPRARRQG
jgi:DNA-binding NtrC family response regulator